MRVNQLFIITALFASCNHLSKEEEVPVNPAGETTSSIKRTNCYQYISGTDTVQMKLINVDGKVSGTLLYHYSGKDRNH